MSDFVLLFRSTPADIQQHVGTPELAQQSLQAWFGWVRELEAGGHLVDPGKPLARGGRVVRGTKRVVTDGPYTETKDLIAGFMVISARDLPEATRLASGCPMLEGEGSVEIRPVERMPA